MTKSEIQTSDEYSRVERIEPDRTAAEQISLQAYQAAYNEITGKTEEISRDYNIAYQLGMSDLEQLNIKVEQLCEQYNLIEANCNVTVFHQEDTKDRFSSFERFKLYNSSNPSPVESILIEYNLLISLPRTQKPQPYKIELRMASGIVVLQQVRERLPAGLLKIIGASSAKVTIEYVDYMLARNIMGAIDDWFKALNISISAKPIKLLRKYSESFPGISKYGLLIFMSYITYKMIGNYFPSDVFSPRILTEFLISAFLLLFFSYKVGAFLGGKLEKSLDATEELSYISLNRGDEKQINKIKANNRKSLIIAAIVFGFNFVVAISASLIANHLSK